MNNEFKKSTKGADTVYTLESASSGGTSAGAIASVSNPVGGVQRRASLVTSEEQKVEAPKPRNFVAKNAKMGGAGAHKDKKKAQKQGDVKHKSKQLDLAEGLQERLAELKQKISEISDRGLHNYRQQAHYNIQGHKFGSLKGPNSDAVIAKREKGMDQAGNKIVARKKAAENERLAALVAKLPELKSEYEEMTARYKALGGSNWQYADREQNLTASEREARSLEGPMNNLWRQISAAEKYQQGQGVAEGAAFGSNYAEQVAQQIFNKRQDIGSEDEVLNQAYHIVSNEQGQKSARYMFNYDEDFSSDLVSAYFWLQKNQGSEQGIKEDSIRPNLVAALKGLGFKGPFKLGQLPEWMKELQDARFDQDTSIMIGGDDPQYDPWVAKGYDYGYAYGMEEGYQTGLSAKQVFNQAKGDTQGRGTVQEGSSDFIGNAIEDLRASKPGLDIESFLDELYFYLDAEWGKQAADQVANADDATHQEWYANYTDMAENTYMEELATKVAEKLDPQAPVDAWVQDFQKADPNKYKQFKNKTPQKKAQMAQAAHYAANEPSKKK